MPRRRSRSSSESDCGSTLIGSLLVIGLVLLALQEVARALLSIPWPVWVVLVGLLAWKRQGVLARWRGLRENWTVSRRSTRFDSEPSSSIPPRLREDWRARRRRRQLEGMLRQDVTSMNGPAFERFLAEYFRSRGYSVRIIGGSGDQGADLLLETAGRRIAVQAKQWKGPVGNAAVQQVYSGMAYYGAREGWVVTPSSFTPAAVNLARSTGVRLYDGAILRSWLAEIAAERQRIEGLRRV